MANRQMSLPLAPSHGSSAYGHPVQPPANTSVAALDLAQYPVNTQQAGYPQPGYSNGQSVYPQSAYGAHPQPAYGSQPQSGYGTPPNGYVYGTQAPAAAYPTQPTVNYQTPTSTYPSQPAYQTPPPASNYQSQPVSSNYNPQPTIGGGTANVGDFIDVGPFTYSGIRETSPERPQRHQSPQRQASPQRPQRYESPQRVPRQESPQRVPIARHESPQRPAPERQASQPTRGHLPWASENTNASDPELGDPDLMYPSRNNSTSVLPNAQAHEHDSASEASHTPEERNPNETSYFSPNPSTENKDKKDWGVRQEGERAGDINSHGKLIPNGPRKRMAVRALEVLCAIGAVIACIYAFAVPKPNPAAPPASRPAVYLIVVFGFITIFVFAYIYIVRGLFGVGRNKDDPYAHAMVLPISRHRPGSNNNSKSQLNLTTNPSENNLTPGVPWSEQQPTSGGVFTSYEREKARLAARKGLWWALGLDVLGALAWGTGFVLAMVGPRCPVGGYSGWCDAFNGAVACSCIGCVLFIVSGVLVGRDLVASRGSDRKLGRN
ncbi:unnamed protein product [Rhizoctonia solani]|uniref:MARVEL domain-containing protein n=1 Tax=Rhizoctonia solani TaxID=456999 RepID=A0A8H3H4L9_9AGAM|nr:unnamed protein product [Rhizoctonia solani]